MASPLQLKAFVEDLFYIRFAARCSNDFFCHGLKPIEALAAHPLRENCDARASEEAGDVGAAPAVVAGARPHGFFGRGIEASRDELGSEAGIGCADLMCTRREPFACKSDDSSLGARDCSRNLDIVD